jgi:hypothetical protein
MSIEDHVLRDTERIAAFEKARADLLEEALREAYDWFMAGEPDEAFASVRKAVGRQAEEPEP